MTKESSTNNTSPLLKNNANKSLLSSGLFKLDSSSLENNIKITTEEDDAVLDISQEDCKVFLLIILCLITSFR